MNLIVFLVVQLRVDVMMYVLFSLREAEASIVSTTGTVSIIGSFLVENS